MSETKQRYHAEIETAIEVARQSGLRSDVDARDGAKIYAYPLREGRIAWGVNAAETERNILRAVREPNGIDTGLSDALAFDLELERRYLQKLQGLSDAQLEREATNMCWQSNYAASREDHNSHWQWQVCEFRVLASKQRSDRRESLGSGHGSERAASAASDDQGGRHRNSSSCAGSAERGRLLSRNDGDGRLSLQPRKRRVLEKAARRDRRP